MKAAVVFKVETEAAAKVVAAEDLTVVNCAMAFAAKKFGGNRISISGGNSGSVSVRNDAAHSPFMISVAPIYSLPLLLPFSIIYSLYADRPLCPHSLSLRKNGLLVYYDYWFSLTLFTICNLYSPIASVYPFSLMLAHSKE